MTVMTKAFSAHMLFYYESVVPYVTGSEQPIQCMEQIHLVFSSTPFEAIEIANRSGEFISESVSDGLTINDKPTRFLFVGVRYVYEIAEKIHCDEVYHSHKELIELSYLDLVFKSKSDMKKYFLEERLTETNCIRTRGGKPRGR